MFLMFLVDVCFFFFFSSRRRHTRYWRDWSSDVCSSDLVVRQATLVVLLLLAQAVLLESALSYLGAGPERPFATWGRIIADGQDYITTAWWLVTIPGLFIVLLVVGVNLVGDGLRDRVRRPRRRAAQTKEA